MRDGERDLRRVGVGDGQHRRAAVVSTGHPHADEAGAEQTPVRRLERERPLDGGCARL